MTIKLGSSKDVIAFLTDDGRTMFEVGIGADGRSLDVRAVDCCHVGGVVYDTRLVVHPECANSITIATKPYDQ